MYDGDDTKIIVYSMRKWLKEKDQKKSRNLCKNTINSCSFVIVEGIMT